MERVHRDESRSSSPGLICRLTGVGEVRIVALDGLGGLLLALRQLLDVARHGRLGAR